MKNDPGIGEILDKMWNRIDAASPEPPVGIKQKKAKKVSTPFINHQARYQKLRRARIHSVRKEQ